MTNDARKLLEKCVAVLQRHIVPDGISDKDALSELYGLLDGPEYRALAQPAASAAPSRSQLRRIAIQKGEPMPEEPEYVLSMRRLHQPSIREAVYYIDALQSKLIASEKYVAVLDELCVERFDEIAALQSKLSAAYAELKKCNDDWNERYGRMLETEGVLQEELVGLRAFKRGVDEALNSGDGTYKP